VFQLIIMSIEGRSNFREDNFDKKTELDESQSRSGAKVDLNNLIKRVKEDEKRSKRQNIVISAAALSAVAVFGIILTL